MKKIFSVGMALVGLILIISGLVLLSYPRTIKKDKIEEIKEFQYGSTLTREEINYYKENIANLKNNSSLYQVYYIHPKENNNESSLQEMIEESVDENRKKKLINFLSEIMPKEKLLSGVGWEPDTDVIKIKDNNDFISIYPCSYSFCMLIYEDNKVKSFFFDEKQNIYDLVRNKY